MRTFKTKPTGRPSGYDPKIADIVALAMCRLGATNPEIAIALNITVKTIKEWKKTHPTFCASLKEGKARADSNVETSLYKRACGYSTTETITEIRKAKSGETTFIKEIKREILPDVTACAIWLNNRKPEHWRDRREITGAGGTPILIAYPEYISPPYLKEKKKDDKKSDN